VWVRDECQNPFLDARATDFYPDWNQAANATVALLYTAAGRAPHDTAPLRDGLWGFCRTGDSSGVQHFGLLGRVFRDGVTAPH
jgi:hypothetical protein